MDHPTCLGADQHEKLAFGGMSVLTNSFGDWQIRNDVVYLDNGAFGANPVSVVKKQNEVKRWIEENPHEFFERSYITALETSRESLASFLHVVPGDLVLLPGATHGLNVVIHSQSFNRDDEILTTNHAYSSVCMALEHVARRDGARIVVVDIPLQVTSPGDILGRIVAGVTSRTRFAVIDHIPSRSGLVLPAKEIVHQLESLGVDTLVDGAHAPGMIPLDLSDINAAFYAANCHKWMCAPRGVGFLHVRRDHAHKIKPLIIARSPYVVGRSKHSSLEHCFSWMGTYCPSAMLSLSCAINHLKTVIPGGYSGLISRNHDLAVLARRIICSAIGIPIPCPDNMIAAMATIPLPDSPGPEQEGMLPIQRTLWEEHRIVIPVYSWPSYPKRVIRLSAQAYNSLDQYLKLANCLRVVLYNERSPVLKSPSNGPAISLARLDTRRISYDSAYSSANESTLACGCGHEAYKWSRASTNPEAPHQDIENPTPWMFIRLAQSRVRRISEGTFTSNPVALFPTAGDVEIQFSLASEKKNRHANLEISRMNYMLSCITRRRVPQAMVPHISHLMATEDIIENWPDMMDTFRNQALTLTRSILFDMAPPRTPATFPVDAQEFVNRVVPYETESGEENVSLTFWHRALADFTAKGQWTPTRVMSFLQIHSFLKDPIGGLREDFDTATDFFFLQFSGLRTELEAAKLCRETWEEIAAQLALESSFISQPLVGRSCYVHFSGDQQVVYAYVDIINLARSEFASPEIVTGMIRDILNQNSVDECCIAPIAIAHSYPVSSSHSAREVIIDGNNRISTLAFLKFISIYGVPYAEKVEGQLQEYCQNHGLGPVYFVDFCAVIELLRDKGMDILDRLSTCESLGGFKRFRQVPALITQESSFLTKLLLEEVEQIAQPVHQCIFATDDLLVALPAKMQTHGRTKGFKALPIR